MISVLRNAVYAKLFSAQVIALVGTGLLTVALGLLAFDIAGGDAGIVVGTALTIKMVAYVAVSPVMVAITARIPRKTLLIAADLTRAVVAVSLLFVTEAWQIYLLIFLLQSASATFTPTFQAVIPEVLPDEREYTRALSLSRLAYDLESLVSPVLAAALLTVISYNNLFVGTVVGFIGSAVLVIATRFPAIRPAAPVPFFDRLTRGARVFLKTVELRSLLAMNLVVATATAMVIVNTVVLVQGDLGRPQSDVALLLAAYGAGSMIIALLLPTVLDRLPDRRVMLTGSAALPAGLLGAFALTAAPVGPATWPLLMVTWLFLGASNSLILTPSARLLRRASDEDNRPAVFAAQFSLSHASFMITYPIAGVVGATWGMWAAAMTLAAIGAVAAVIATFTWRHADALTASQPAPEGVGR
ncbi:Major Facilitator Superfamily protein [Microbacterium hydrocarbonoxydans]|uniref:Major Facilitator Superfamily protein n=1 Tax=Microbacterium hydrocarbonoxydans TaxID=273678 RepID=A0A0M2HKX9_9MICO|nr:MFS transporter [Microbacterium hydrocarbonoxydans]KJL47402.1 Major Facilitator Superfamily protein [Microbacterium hydrocarbonoxydans]